jgi:hypothetical protein
MCWVVIIPLYQFFHPPIFRISQGKIFIDPNLPGVAPATRTALYRQMATALAQLHSADAYKLGLQVGSG